MKHSVAEAGGKLGLTPKLGISSQLGLCHSPQESRDSEDGSPKSGSKSAHVILGN